MEPYVGQASLLETIYFVGATNVSRGRNYGRMGRVLCLFRMKVGFKLVKGLIFKVMLSKDDDGW